MKKIPTLFVRDFINEHEFILTDKVTEGCEVVLQGKTVPTVKVDGACCFVDSDGTFYKRYDAKNGKKPPEGAIPCCEPDPITGHWPHWVKVDPDNPADKWFIEAYNVSNPKPGYTYEAIGTHFQTNPYKIDCDILVQHGAMIITKLSDLSYDGIKEYLSTHYIEGIVFWYNGAPLCKIKRSDFGFEWNGSKKSVRSR